MGDAAKYGLSENDVRKLKEIKTWFERNKGLFGQPSRRNPRLFGDGAAGAETRRAVVIVAPARPDPTAAPGSPEYDGWGYYKLRLLGDTTAAWVSTTEYIIGSEVIGSDNLKYISKTSPNVGNNPVGDAVNWEVSEEIKVEYALGLEATAAPYPVVTARDLRYCVPWFEPGAIVPITSRVVGANTRYYIDQTFTYCGEPEDSGLVYDTAHKITRAVFA